MEGENLEIQADVAAPEQGITTAPESVETETSNQDVEKESKTFTQEELEAAIGKRLAKERRKMEREFAAKLTQPVQQTPAEPPTPGQFETWEAYAEALAEQKAQEKLAQQQAHQRQTEVENAWLDRVEKATEKYDDFEQVVIKNPTLQITPEMAEAIKTSDNGPDVAYWLALNPQEASRIARLTPLQQAREIGKIEVKVAAEPIVKKTSSAPEPITPVTAKRTSVPSYDTTDPRSTKTMSDSEWILAEQRRLEQKARNR